MLPIGSVVGGLTLLVLYTVLYSVRAHLCRAPTASAAGHGSHRVLTSLSCGPLQAASVTRELVAQTSQRLCHLHPLDLNYPRSPHLSPACPCRVFLLFTAVISPRRAFGR